MLMNKNDSVLKSPIPTPYVRISICEIIISLSVGFRRISSYSLSESNDFTGSKLLLVEEN